MKKHLFMMSLAIAFIACSKSEDDSKGGDIASSATFSAVIKDGFTGENGEDLIPLKSLKNIVVGDYIPYTITISETDTQFSGNYVVVPTRTTEKNHQSLQVDYEFYFENAKGEKVKATQPRITFEKAGKHKFYLKPLVPGSFQLPFIVQKEQDKQKVGELKLPTVNFNAVKIFAYSYGRDTGKKKWIWDEFETHSINRRNFIFKIDQGKNETDIYLSPAGADQIFQVKYNNEIATGEFKAGQKYEYYPEMERIGSVPHLPEPTVTITIIQKRSQQEEYVIEYHNVPIVEGEVPN
jgi:hypothetical protein